MGIVAKVPITEDILPRKEILMKTANIADKHCIICLSQKLDLSTLQMHFILKHNGLDIDSPLDEWLYEECLYEMGNNKYYNSDDENRSDNDNEWEEHTNSQEDSSFNQFT